VTRGLVPLERIGLVTRATGARDARDARVAYAALTDTGRARLADMLTTAEFSPACSGWPRRTRCSARRSRPLRIADEVEGVAADARATAAQVALAWLLAKGDDIATTTNKQTCGYSAADQARCLDAGPGPTPLSTHTAPDERWIGEKDHGVFRTAQGVARRIGSRPSQLTAAR
jgi:DNA-binding MarR family transcriptional regulator